MLAGMRKVAGGFFAKLLLLLLIASLAVWGIGDIFRGGNDNAIATIAGNSITIDEYEAILNNVRQNLGPNVPPGLLQQLDIPNQLLQSLINQKLLAAEASALGVNISDKTLLEKLRNLPEFQDENNNFSKELFITILRNNRLSEQMFLTQLRERLASELVEQTITGARSVPTALVQYMYRLQNEKRIASIVVLPTSNSFSKDPEEEVLRSFFQPISDQFIQEEKRRLGYIIIDPNSINAQIAVSEKDLLSAYNEQKNDLAITQRREVEQVIVDTKEKAQKIIELLNSGTVFSRAVSQAEIGAKVVSLGTITKDLLFGEAQSAVFTRNAGETTAPIQSEFGWHIYHVLSVEKKEEVALDDIKETLEKEIRAQKFAQTLHTLEIEIEDAIAAGTSLEELAATAHGQYYTTPLLPVSALLQVKGVPQDILRQGISIEPGYPSSLMGMQDSRYFIVEVIEDEEPRVKSFEEARAEVLALYKKKEQQKKVQEEVNAAYKEIRDKGMQAYAKKHKLPVIKTNAFMRTDSTIELTKNISDIELSGAFINILFSLLPDSVSEPHPVANNRYVVGKIDQIISAHVPDNSVQAKGLLEKTKAELIKHYSTELLGQYLLHLRRKYDVSINEEAFNSVMQP